MQWVITCWSHEFQLDCGFFKSLWHNEQYLGLASCSIKARICASNWNWAKPDSAIAIRMVWRYRLRAFSSSLPETKSLRTFSAASNWLPKNLLFEVFCFAFSSSLRILEISAVCLRISSYACWKCGPFVIAFKYALNINCDRNIIWQWLRSGFFLSISFPNASQVFKWKSNGNRDPLNFFKSATILALICFHCTPVECSFAAYQSKTFNSVSLKLVINFAAAIMSRSSANIQETIVFQFRPLVDSYAELTFSRQAVQWMFYLETIETFQKLFFF